MIQQWKPPVVWFIRNKAGNSVGVPTTFLFPFRVPTPDSRLLVSIALVATQDSGSGSGLPMATIPWDMTYAGALTWSLWLAARDFDLGGAGAPIPTVNLVGTKGAPVVIPSDSGIDGYGDDFGGGQDEIYGELTLVDNGTGGLRGFNMGLYVTYEPGACAICDDEWRVIVRDCTPQLAGTPVSI